MSVIRTEIEFGQGEQGVLFAPDRPNPPGAVVILHERYGLVQHTLDLAEKLAGDGFLALAPDLFSRWQGDKEALKRGDVRVTLPDSEVAATVNRALDYVELRVPDARLAVMGVCQSGRYSIVVGSQRRNLAGVVVFYGASQLSDWEVTDLQPVPMPEMIGQLSAPGLFVFGEGDHVISIDDVLRVKGALESSRKSYRMKVFAGMPHGWLNDTMPGRYRAREAQQAWELLLTFLSEAFERRWPGEGRVAWEFSSDISDHYDFSKNIRLE